MSKIGWVLAVIVPAATAIGIVLWDDENGRERPELSTRPIALTVAEQPLTIPANVLRFVGQRRPGAHGRLDLALAWPDLAGRGETNVDLFDAPGRQPDIVWVTITPRGEAMSGIERLATVYGRLFVGEAWEGPAGLQGRRLSAKAGYVGEEVYYEPGAVRPFVARCYARDATGPVDTCLHDEVIGRLWVQWRFARERLDDWQGLAERMETRLAEWGARGP